MKVLEGGKNIHYLLSGWECMCANRWVKWNGAVGDTSRCTVGRSELVEFEHTVWKYAALIRPPVHAACAESSTLLTAPWEAYGPDVNYNWIHILPATLFRASLAFSYRRIAVGFYLLQPPCITILLDFIQSGARRAALCRFESLAFIIVKV